MLLDLTLESPCISSTISVRCIPLRHVYGTNIKNKVLLTLETEYAPDKGNSFVIYNPRVHTLSYRRARAAYRCGGRLFVGGVDINVHVRFWIGTKVTIQISDETLGRGRLCSLAIPGVRNHFRALQNLSEDWLSWFLGQQTWQRRQTLQASFEAP